jgi:hypothetical protein
MTDEIPKECSLTIAEIEPLTLSVLAQAERTEVLDDVGYRIAVELRQGIKALIAEIGRTCDPVIWDTDAAHKSALKLKRVLMAKPDQAMLIVNRKLLAFDEALREKEREAEKIKKDAADAKARAESDLKKAEALAAKGDVVRAEKIFEKAAAGETKAAEISRTIVPAPVRPVVVGTYFVDAWKVKRIFDPAAVPREFCSPDLVLLNKEAREKKDAAKVDGVEFFNDRAPRSRG